MEIRLYLRMILRGWWLILLTTLAALNIALVIAYLATPLYRASAKFVVSPSPSLSREGDVVSSLDTLDKRSIISTYAEVLNSQRIYSQTIESLELTPDSVSGYVGSVVVLPDAAVLELSFDGPDPRVATLLVNSVGSQAIEYSKSLNQVYDLSFLDPAIVPTEPYTPQPVRDSALAVVLGIAIGSALAIIREQLLIPLDALRQRNIIDSTSSAYTRRHFQTLLEKELARSSISPLSIALIRLQGLNELIDTLPPAIVYQLLHEITVILRNELRGSDSIGRWDDTCFALLLPATPGGAATRTVERIVQSLSMPIHIEQLDFEIEPRYGLGVRQANELASSLIQRAETSLDQSLQKTGQTMPFSSDVLNSLDFWEKGAEALTGPAKPEAPTSPFIEPGDKK